MRARGLIANTKVQRYLAAMFIAGALVLALGPLLFLSFAAVQTPSLITLAALNGLGWIGLAASLFNQKRILHAVRESITRVGFDVPTGDLSELVIEYTKQSTRYHRAAYAFRVNSSDRGAHLSRNLLRIVQLAYEELPAVAVELALYDEASGRWTQSIIVGTPSSFESQAALAAEEAKRIQRTKEFSPNATGQVIAKPVTLARTNFGVLRVELQKAVDFTNADRQVLNLLAAQGGLLLVDARFTQEILRMRNAEEETSRAKAGFLANLSHEIRGPLGVILSGVEVALEGMCGELTEEQREMLHMIKDSGDHLLDLVNDVLDYARIEAGKISATPVVLPVGPLLEDLTAVIRSQAHAKQHQLVLQDVEPNLGITCDKRHARQMLINFLTNAIKYTPEGGTVTVAATRCTSGKVKISVTDTGIGIPEEQQEKVFSAFERVDDTYANAQTGTGLGMPLTRRLAEVNKGTVGFESVAGEGSTFWLMLPASEVEQIAVDDHDDAPSTGSLGRGERILLVDRKHEMSEMTERYLDQQGFSVVRAASNVDILRATREQPVALALVDNDLAELSGVDIISVIRSMPSGASIPVVLLSSRAFAFDIAKYLQLGVDRCLSKPVSLREIAATVRSLLDNNTDIGVPDGVAPSDDEARL
ncbi:MAG: response regulator [Bdellovibrionales bacterium]|nr:response regulator [Bdellovibrionales bacterium]